MLHSLIPCNITFLPFFVSLVFLFIFWLAMVVLTSVFNETYHGLFPSTKISQTKAQIAYDDFHNRKTDVETIYKFKPRNNLKLTKNTKILSSKPKYPQLAENERNHTTSLKRNTLNRSELACYQLILVSQKRGGEVVTSLSHGSKNF